VNNIDLGRYGRYRTNVWRCPGANSFAAQFGTLSMYGTDALAIQALIAADPALGHPLDAALPYLAAEVVWAAREEMACTVEDILSRRTRALLLKREGRCPHGPRVAELLAKELAVTSRGRRSKSPPSPNSPAGYQVST